MGRVWSGLVNSGQQNPAPLDTIKDRTEIDRLVARMEQHLRDESAPALWEDVQFLKNCLIYSGCDAYRRWNAIRLDVVRCLFHGLPFEQFLEIPTGPSFYKFDIMEALDEIADALPIEHLFALSERFQIIPREHNRPRLFQRLVDAPDEAVTLWLQQWIEDRLSTEQAQGAALSSHLKAVSTFTIRWMPDDKDLSPAVAILCRRRDARARQLVADYLFALPWGQDRQATAALLAGLADDKTEQGRSLLREALLAYPDPSALRLLLLGAYRQSDPGEALEIGWQDLGRVDSDQARVAYLDWLGGAGELPPSEAAGQNRLAARVAELDLRGWDGLTRGYLALLLRSRFPALPEPPGVRRSDRAAIGMVRLFNVIRMEHMAAIVYLPVFGIAFLYLRLLDHFLGKPPKPVRLLEMALLVLWIVATLVTQHTHFSGRETLRLRFQMALCLFAALGCFVVVPLAVHLLPR